MKQLIRRLSRVSDSSYEEGLLLPRSSPKGPRRRSSSNGDDDGISCGRGAGAGAGRRGWRAEVPEGHLPVYVGEEMERFVVRADLLNRPVFLELLRRSAEEYGYEQRGVLRIPCPVPLFQRVLDLLLADAAPEARRPEDLDRWIRGETPLQPLPSS
ncbi:hypothetical protein Taro_034114 [Colocasia esculenta]|uniref:Uncharacterized protein n=1 Tax=Colocasia esculenta TaxID=4460 RepID=A0A843VWY3_COLES|nr:hypothetical protein [Colocasia esculenta]